MFFNERERKRTKALIILNYRILNIVITLIVMMFFIFMAILSIHEISHAYIARLVGCENFEITFDIIERHTYTTLQCPADAHLGYIAMSGLIVTSLLSLLFLTFGKFPEAKLWIISLGFSIILSSQDIFLFYGDVGFFITFFLGTVFLGLGITKFIESHYNPV